MRTKSKKSGKKSQRLRRVGLGAGLLVVAGLATASDAFRQGAARAIDVGLSPLVQYLPSYRRAQDMLINAIAAANRAERRVSAQAERISELEWEADTLRAAAERVDQAHDRESDELAKRLRLLSAQLVEATRADEDVSVRYNQDESTVIRVGNQVLYDRGSAELKPAGRALLGRIASTLTNHGDGAITVEGHTDNLPISSARVRAKYPTNWHLSAARAASAVAYLQRATRIAPSRLRAAGYGEHRPVQSNDSYGGRAANRRIEIVIEADQTASDRQTHAGVEDTPLERS